MFGARSILGRSIVIHKKQRSLSCQRSSLTLRKIITLRRGVAGRSVAFSDFTSSRNILSVRSLLLSLFLPLLLLLEMLRGILLERRLPPRPSLELLLLLRFRLSTLYPRLLSTQSQAPPGLWSPLLPRLWSTLLPRLRCTLHPGLWT